MNSVFSLCRARRYYSVVPMGTNYAETVRSDENTRARCARRSGQLGRPPSLGPAAGHFRDQLTLHSGSINGTRLRYVHPYKTVARISIYLYERVYEIRIVFERGKLASA